MSIESGSIVVEKPDVGEGDRPVELPRRVLGKTGEEVPILGLGTGPGGMGLSNEAAIALYHRAIDLGVTYLDTAPGYERAHVQLGEVMRERRDEVFLVTKTNTETAEGALEILEQGLKDIQTDYADLVYVHTLGRKDVDRVLAPDGALAGLREAQRRGWTRHVGFTSHNAPWKGAKILREAEVDAVMLAMNVADRHTYNFEEEVLPLAVEQNAGVAAMKVYGGARGMKYQEPVHSALADEGMHDHERAMRYALSLPGVTVAVIGMFSEAELLQNIEWARNYTPLTTDEEARLMGSGKEIAAELGAHYGPVR